MSLIDSYLGIFSGGIPIDTDPSQSQRYRLVLRAALAGLPWGGDRLDLRREFARWRRGEKYIPHEVQQAMLAAVIGSWPGDFDREALIEALRLPTIKPVATKLKQS